MEAKNQEPLGFESMMNTWTTSMNHLSEGTTPPPSFFQAVSPEFSSPFQNFGKAFQEGSEPSFQWPFPWAQSTQSGDDFPKTDQNKHRKTDQETEKESFNDPMALAMKNWQVLSNAITSPSFASSLFKGLGTLPEIFTNFTDSNISGLAEIHDKIVKRASQMVESVDAYSFENMDETLFQMWVDMYDKEFRKFLHIPQLGLTREYQEQFNDMVDKSNRSQIHLADLLRLLSIPFQRAAVGMQEEVHALAEKGELSEDPKVYYQMWIKILEGHFMKLFQTPEYTKSLSNTISAMSQFSQSKAAVLEDMLKPLPIASRSEMDDLAREFNQLKREIRVLKKKTA